MQNYRVIKDRLWIILCGLAIFINFAAFLINGYSLIYFFAMILCIAVLVWNIKIYEKRQNKKR
jgi:Flp pilus assembly protein TadB